MWVPDKRLAPARLAQVGEELLKSYNKGVALLTGLPLVSDDRISRIQQGIELWVLELEGILDREWSSAIKKLLVGDSGAKNLAESTKGRLAKLNKLIEGDTLVLNCRGSELQEGAPITTKTGRKCAQGELASID